MHSWFIFREKGQQCQPEVEATNSLYPYVALLASFLVQAVSVGLAFSVAAFFVDWVEAFDATKTETAWVGSINIALVFLAG